MNGHEQDRRMLAIEEMERELAEPLGNFRGAVTALAEREMARTPQMALRAERTARWRTMWLYAWVPAALLLLLTIGLAMTTHGPAQQPVMQEPSVAKVEAAPTPQHVSDNKLLTEIDADLTQNVPTPFAPLEVTTTSKTHTTTTQAEDNYVVEP